MRVQLGILRLASRLVPAADRTEWLAEWTAELCHIHARRRKAATRFSLGAFRDALWLRRNHPDPQPWPRLRLDSPVACLGFLTVLAAAAVLLAFHLPGPRDVLAPAPYLNAQRLVMITPAGHFSPDRPEFTVEAYRSLTDRAQNVFAEVAFYRPVAARAGNAPLSVALSSAKLFDMLSLPAPAGARLILSDHAWRKLFHADPHIAGRTLEILGHPAPVAAILPASWWRLPGQFDAWLLDDEPVAALPPDAKGFVLARRIGAMHDPRSLVAVPNGPAAFDIFECAALPRDPTRLANLLLLALAVLILPAFASLPLGEYPADRHARRWVFLAAKVALLLPIAFFGTLDVGSFLSQSIRPQGILIGYILAFRWALIDQRRRCPVCLRLLGHPARIGRPSYILLEWYGTELMCDRGHGLLHVRDTAASPYGLQSWLQLDPSWNSLFSSKPTTGAA